MTRKWNKPDVLLITGDCIEGRQERQGGAELITNDRNVQGEMAVYCLKQWNAKKIFMVYGTQYHTSSTGEDFEYTIAKDLDAKIQGRLFLNIEGIVIDARHKVGTSGVPQGRATALLRSLAWNAIKNALDEEPKANIIVRGHAHYHILVEDPPRMAFTMPSLQLSRGRYGSRECEGRTHWGAIRLTIHKGQVINKEVNLWNLTANKPHAIKIK